MRYIKTKKGNIALPVMTPIIVPISNGYIL